MEECTKSENGENGEEFFEKEVIEWWDNNEVEWFPRKPKITIMKMVSTLCPEARGFQSEMFSRGKAFLCFVEDLPFKGLNSIEFITGYCVIGNYAGPKNQFLDWCKDPPENNGDGWDESDIFSDTKEEAVAKKLQDINNMAERETLCKYCEKKEACIANLRSLIQESIKTEIQENTSGVIQSLIQ